MHKLMTKSLSALLIICGLSLLSPLAGAGDKAPAGASGKLAYVLKIDGPITPATDDLIARHLKRAEQRKAAAVVLQMHTPGGLYDSTQNIIQNVLDSRVPVVTYVSPAGSHAASAGTYILYASHVAAMAPGTNLGAATPVNMGGGDADDDGKKKSGAMESKMVNDAAAYLRGLAELRGRNAKWAEQAVRDAHSLTATEALAEKVIDVTATDIPDLLRKIDGRTVKMAGQATAVLDTDGAEIETVEPDWRHNFLDVITHPNVAFLLMTLGMYGLIYEFANPGAYAPGVIGVIALLMGLYALNVLPVNYAGLALLFVGILMMAAEAVTPTFGMLGIGGAAAFAIGATMLIDSDMPGYGIDPWLIAALTASSLLLLSVVLAMAVKSMRRPKVTGVEELQGATATVVRWAQGRGEVRVTGEIWQAASSPDFVIAPGDPVRVVAIDGLVLTVEPHIPV